MKQSETKSIMSISKKGDTVRINKAVNFDDRIKYLDSYNMRPKSSDILLSDKERLTNQREDNQKSGKKNNFRINNQEENSMLENMKKKQIQIENIKKEKAEIIKKQMEKVQLLKEQKLENEKLRNKKIKILRQNLGMDKNSHSDNKTINNYISAELEAKLKLDLEKTRKDSNVIAHSSNPTRNAIAPEQILHKKEYATSRNNMHRNKYNEPRTDKNHKDFLYYSKLENNKMTTINEVEDNESIDNLTDNKAYQFETRSNILNSNTAIKNVDSIHKIYASRENVMKSCDQNKFNNSRTSSSYTVEPIALNIESKNKNEEKNNLRKNSNEKNLTLDLDLETTDSNYITANYNLLSRKELYDSSNKSTSRENTQRSKPYTTDERQKLNLPEANFNLDTLTTLQSNVILNTQVALPTHGDKLNSMTSHEYDGVSNLGSDVKIKINSIEFDSDLNNE